MEVAESASWRALWKRFQEWKDEQSTNTHQLLKQLVKESLEERNRADVTADHLSMLSSFVSPLLLAIRSGHMTTTDDRWGAAFEGVKLLRNLMAGMQENQLLLLNDASLLFAIVSLCDFLLSFATKDVVTFDLLKTSLQLLGNLCVCCSKGQETIWRMCYPEAFKHLLQCTHPQAVDITCMVLYTILKDNAAYRKEFSSLLCPLLGSLATLPDPLEWRDLLLEHLISQSPLQALWKRLNPTKEGLALLNYILERVLEYTQENAVHIEESQKDCEDTLSGMQCRTEHSPEVHGKNANQTEPGSDLYVAMITEENVDCLQRLYTEHAQYLLAHDAAALVRLSAGDKEEEDLAEVQLTVCSLGLLNSLCGNKTVLRRLQANDELLTVTLDLLKNLSILDGSAYSARHRSRLQESTPTNKDKLHPLFGFKRDLVQMVANLSFKCPRLQERVNKLGAFPVVLNQCSIDHHNPYITQWAILAIRNLCENNPTNQMLVANLESRGAPNTQELLQQLGCEVDVDKDGKMKVKGRSS